MQTGGGPHESTQANIIKLFEKVLFGNEDMKTRRAGLHDLIAVQTPLKGFYCVCLGRLV